MPRLRVTVGLVMLLLCCAVPVMGALQLFTLFGMSVEVDLDEVADAMRDVGEGHERMSKGWINLTRELFDKGALRFDFAAQQVERTANAVNFNFHQFIESLKQASHLPGVGFFQVSDSLKRLVEAFEAFKNGDFNVGNKIAKHAKVVAEQFRRSAKEIGNETQVTFLETLSAALDEISQRVELLDIPEYDAKMVQEFVVATVHDTMTEVMQIPSISKAVSSFHQFKESIVNLATNLQLALVCSLALICSALLVWGLTARVAMSWLVMAIVVPLALAVPMAYRNNPLSYLAEHPAALHCPMAVNILTANQDRTFAVPHRNVFNDLSAPLYVYVPVGKYNTAKTVEQAFTAYALMDPEQRLHCHGVSFLFGVRAVGPKERNLAAGGKTQTMSAVVFDVQSIKQRARQFPAVAAVLNDKYVRGGHLILLNVPGTEDPHEVTYAFKGNALSMQSLALTLSSYARLALSVPPSVADSDKLARFDTIQHIANVYSQPGGCLTDDGDHAKTMQRTHFDIKVKDGSDLLVYVNCVQWNDENDQVIHIDDDCALQVTMTQLYSREQIDGVLNSVPHCSANFRSMYPTLQLYSPVALGVLSHPRVLHEKSFLQDLFRYHRAPPPEWYPRRSNMSVISHSVSMFDYYVPQLLATLAEYPKHIGTREADGKDLNAAIQTFSNYFQSHRAHGQNAVLQYASNITRADAIALQCDQVKSIVEGWKSSEVAMLVRKIPVVSAGRSCKCSDETLATELNPLIDGIKRQLCTHLKLMGGLSGIHQQCAREIRNEIDSVRESLFQQQRDVCAKLDWHPSPWSVCDGVCPGTKTRKWTCGSDATLRHRQCCDNMRGKADQHPPTETADCEAWMYEWKASGFGSCLKPKCGMQTQTRTCVRCPGVSHWESRGAGEEHCSQPGPPLEQRCNVDIYDWSASVWTPAKCSCGSEQLRTVDCVNACNEPVSDKSLCVLTHQPKNMQSCVDVHWVNIGWKSVTSSQIRCGERQTTFQCQVCAPVSSIRSDEECQARHGSPSPVVEECKCRDEVNSDYSLDLWGPTCGGHAKKDEHGWCQKHCDSLSGVKFCKATEDWRKRKGTRWTGERYCKSGAQVVCICHCQASDCWA